MVVGTRHSLKANNCMQHVRCACEQCHLLELFGIGCHCSQHSYFFPLFLSTFVKVSTKVIGLFDEAEF